MEITLLPPSRRGAANLQPNLMMDLEREKEQYPVYSPEDCPEGLIDISSSSNALMRPHVERWVDSTLTQLNRDIKDSEKSQPSKGQSQLLTCICQVSGTLQQPARWP